MLIRIWGSRGSIPVSGKEYLKYGGDTTCVEIRTKNDEIIIIDAGSGIRRLGNQLLKEGKKRYHLIFTHAHWDHIVGFPIFKPIYFKRTSLSIYGCGFKLKSIKNMISETMRPPFFPVEFKNIGAKISYNDICSNKEFQIDTLSITPIFLSHPNQGLGYKIREDDKTFVFLTDNELTFVHTGGLQYKDYCGFSRGSNLLIHDAEFTENEYIKTISWGHSIYKDALRLALEAEVEKFGLFHHNQERSDNQVDEIVNNCNEIIADKNSSLKCFAVSCDMKIEL